MYPQRNPAMTLQEKAYFPSRAHSYTNSILFPRSLERQYCGLDCLPLNKLKSHPSSYAAVGISKKAIFWS